MKNTGPHQFHPPRVNLLVRCGLDDRLNLFVGAGKIPSHLRGLCGTLILEGFRQR